MPLAIPALNRDRRKSAEIEHRLSASALPAARIRRRGRCRHRTGPTIGGEVHPFELPKEIAVNTATTAGKNRASPVQSNAHAGLEVAAPGDQEQPGDHAEQRRRAR